MPSRVSRAAVAVPTPTQNEYTSAPPGFTFRDAAQNLFHKCGREKPHWKKVIFEARHATSIIGAQIQLLADVRAIIPRVVEFEARPDHWVRATEHEPDDANVALAMAIAVETWAMFRSESGSRDVPVRAASEVMGSVGEGYGIEYPSRRHAKPAVAVVHTPAITVHKDGTADWRLRESGKPITLQPGQFERLFVEDETFIDDCTSPFRQLADDVAALEIVNAALRAGGTADLVSRGLMWAPATGPNEAASWLDDYADVVEQVREDPFILGGLVPFPVTSGAEPPQYVSLGSIQETLIKLHELLVDVIARGCPLPAKLVKDGPGEGNAYADHVLNRVFLQFSAMPFLVQHVYPDLACWWWHPRLDRNPQFVGTGIESCRFRIGGDVAMIANRPDSRKEALDGRRLGLFTKRFVGEQFGASDDDLLQPGTPEHDEWLETIGLVAPRSGLGGSGPDEEQRPADGFTTGTELGPRFAELTPEPVTVERFEPLESIW